MSSIEIGDRPSFSRNTSLARAAGRRSLENPPGFRCREACGTSGRAARRTTAQTASTAHRRRHRRSPNEYNKAAV
jgi:hypothetical protein